MFIFGNITSSVSEYQPSLFKRKWKLLKDGENNHEKCFFSKRKCLICKLTHNKDKFKHQSITLTYKVIWSHIRILNVYNFSSNNTSYIHLFYRHSDIGTCGERHMRRHMSFQHGLQRTWISTQRNCLISCIFTGGGNYATTTKKKGGLYKLKPGLPLIKHWEPVYWGSKVEQRYFSQNLTSLSPDLSSFSL